MKFSYWRWSFMLSRTRAAWVMAVMWVGERGKCLSAL